MKKKLKILIFAMVVMFAAGASSAFAKNASDTYFTRSKIGFSTTLNAYNTGSRRKDDDSSHYIKNTSGVNIRVRSYTNSGLNKTKHGYADIPTAERFIYNNIYEDGYRSCKLKITTTRSGTSGYLTGCWSPDSVGSYIVANP